MGLVCDQGDAGVAPTLGNSAIIDALGLVGIPRSMPALRTLLEGADWDAAEFVKGALAMIAKRQ